MLCEEAHALPFSCQGSHTTRLQPPTAILSPSCPPSHAGVQAGTAYPRGVACNGLTIVGIFGGTSFASSFQHLEERYTTK